MIQISLIVLSIFLILPKEKYVTLKQVILPIVFLCIACAIPFVQLYDPSPMIFEPPSYPPPGYSTQWWYYLIGDYDYFFRQRLSPKSIPFWVFTDIFLLQMNVPLWTRPIVDFAMNIAIASSVCILWWFTVFWVFSGTTTWVIVPVIAVPIIGTFFVAFHRTIKWQCKNLNLN
ncbi:MAG: hypothetical protein ACFFCT_12120, partial [Candidatus Odinarchaeota archaeon]